MPVSMRLLVRNCWVGLKFNENNPVSTLEGKWRLAAQRLKLLELGKTQVFF